MMLHYYNKLLHSSGKCGIWSLNFLASRQTWIGFLVLFPPCLPGKGTKYDTKMHLGLSPWVLPQTQNDLEAIYVVYFVFKINLPKRRNSALWTGDNDTNFWIFIYKNQRIRCKRSFQRYHGDSWKSLEDLRFQKLINELSISTDADFTYYHYINK